MNIRLASIEDRENWDNYVLTHTDASPYHLFAWKMAVEDAYKHIGYYLMAEENSQLLGVLPLVYLKPPLLSGQLVSLPFCDLGGALINCDKVRHELVIESIALAKKLKAKQIEWRSNMTTSSSKIQSLPVFTQSHKVSLLLGLPSSAEQLWDNFKSKLRSQIRKAEKNGLHFVWGSLKQLRDFYYLFSCNMRELGSPIHSKKWFKFILLHYGEKARLGLVYHDFKPIGGGIILTVGRKICVSWASTLREYNNLSPNMLLYWSFLKHAADNGYTQFDFGRSTPDEGTYKFKLQWGSIPVPLYWNYIIMNGKEFKFNRTTSTNRDRVERIWQKLPLTLTNYMGPTIRKYISL